ncbi:MAG: efflux RND transporter periplasmic adaptor subunit [Phycisphaerales bacterium]|nr:efflux RND transporter periplasmic adaptor subunit [Phycisphaerales bacterium]
MMKTDIPTHESPPTLEYASTPPASRTVRFLRVFVSAGLVLSLLGAGYGGFMALMTTKPKAKRSVSTAPLPLVGIQTLMPEDIQEIFVGYGSARADRESLISAEISGQIMHVPDRIKDGAMVEKGETLVSIDDRQYRRELDKALGELADIEAQLDRIGIERTNVERLIAIAEREVQVQKDEYKRLSDLYEANSASKKEWDFSRLEYERSNRVLQGLQNDLALIPARKAGLRATRDARQAAVELARLDVDRCAIKAPFSAQIDRIMVEIGDRVQVGGQIVRLVGKRFIEVPVELPLAVRPKTKAGTEAVLTMDSIPETQWNARVRRLSPEADAASRTFTVYLEVDNEEQSTPLVPGYFLTARISGPTITDAFVIPRGVIMENRIFVANDGQAHVREIQVVCFVRDRAVISGDVKPGDKVILTNLDILYESAAVRWQDDALEGTP